MSEHKTEARLSTATANFSTAKFVEPHYSQFCMLCDNTRAIPYPTHSSWVCDECKEAIVFVKDFMKSCNKAQTMLNEMKDHD